MTENKTVFDKAADELSDALSGDVDSATFVDDVLNACERLRAAMDLMRHKVNGLPVH